MSRFFVPKESVKGNRIYITGKEAHHILDVMRLKVSDEVVVFDGTGKEYAGIVRQIARKALTVDIRETHNVPFNEGYSVTIIQAIPKKEKMDYIAEKATELGVSCIIPVTTARTIPDWNENKKAAIVERWLKISREASKQCGRPDVPDIRPIIGFEQAIKGIKGYDLKLMAALSDKAIKLKDALKSCDKGNIAVAIGPEGDFTSEEAEMAAKEDFKIVNLGPRVLKSDTAGLAVLSMINYEYAG